MRSSLLILAIVAGWCLGCCCGAVEPRSGHHHHHPASDAVAQLARKLVLGSILQDVCPSDSGVISPLSVASSIMTFLASSVEGGETREQLLRLMGQPVEAAADAAAAADAFNSLLADFGKVRDEVRLTPLARPVRLPGCESDEDDDYEYDDDDGSGGGDNVTIADGELTTANSNSTAPIVHVTDAVFVNRNVMPPPLRRVLDTSNRVHIYPVDFASQEQARTDINGWVSNNTRGLIGEIIPIGLLTKRTQLVVVNALYFRAHWRTPFDARSDLEFVTDQGGVVERISAPAMYTIGCFPYAASAELDAQIVALPYAAAAQGERGNDAGGGITAYIVIPRRANRARLNQLMYRLKGPTALDELIGSLRMTTVTLTMPRLHLETQFSLKSVFELLGVQSLFRTGINLRRFASAAATSAPASASTSTTEAAAADDNSSSESKTQKPTPESSSSPPPPMDDTVPVENVLHKVTLKVDRTGTEGAAATSSLLDRSMSQAQMTVGGPFLIFIRHDRTGMLLFYGPVYRPDSAPVDAAKS
jgi:serine protease inhibitor